MATANYTPDRIAIDLVEPFGVSLNNVTLEEHGSLLAAEEFADRLRKALRANAPDRTNIDAADLAGQRLRQAAGVLASLWQSSAFDPLDELDASAVDAVGLLLGQGLEAVRSLNFQHGRTAQ